MAYNVVLRRNGAKVGHFGPFGTKKQAITQGQVLADDAARDVVVSVEPQRKKATAKRKNTRRSASKSASNEIKTLAKLKSISVGEIIHGTGGIVYVTEKGDSGRGYWAKADSAVGRALERMRLKSYRTNTRTTRANSAIPHTKKAFVKEYYDLLTRFFKTRQYLGAGKYSTPTGKSMQISNRLAALYDAHPSWADEVDDQWSDDQRMNTNPRPMATNTRTTRANWGAGSFAEKPVTLIFSTKEKANAFKKSLDKNEVSGKFSTRKTKGWNTYSLIFTPYSYSDVVAIRKYYRPEKSHYKDIERDLRTNPRTTRKKKGHSFKKGQIVRLKPEGLRLHSRSTPASMGYSQYTIDWRRKVSDMAGQDLVISESQGWMWPESDNVTIDAPDGSLILLYDYMLEPATRTNTRRTRTNGVGPDSSGRNWTNMGGRWVWAADGADGPAFTVVEKEAPFGTYYKLQIMLPDGSMYKAANQKRQKKDLFKRAKSLYQAWGSAAGFDLSRQPEKWARTNTRRANPSRGAFKSVSKTSAPYTHYTVARGLLTSGHKSRKEALKQASGQKANVKTAAQAKEYLGRKSDGQYRSLTSSASWYSHSR